jgi:hypothetical protein
MADQKISDMSAAGALSGTELVELVQSGSNVRTTVAALTATATGVSQPLDSDLTAIAALTTTSFGRSLLAAADAAALRVLADSPSNSEAILDVLVDAKGDLLVGTAADTVARMAVGTNGQRLVADSTVTNGMAWAADPDLVWAPTGAVGQAFKRDGATIINNATLTTQILFLAGGRIANGVTVTNLSFRSGATAANVPTNWWFGLFDSAGAILGLTADQTTTAWAGQTTKTLALTTPFVTTYGGRYFAGLMVKATTVPTIQGAAPAAFGVADAPVPSGTSSTGSGTLTDPASLGAGPVALPTSTGQWPYWWAT